MNRASGNHRHCRLLSAMAVLLCGAALLSSSIAMGAETTAVGPNILFILTDQQRFDALGTVSPGLKTPALDRLCREGVRFDRVYAAQAVCTPSRASIFSGLFSHTHKLQHNVYGVDDALSDPQYKLGLTWPLLLGQAGYRTGYVGKWHLGEKGPKCFDEWFGFNSLKSHWMGKAQQSQYRSDCETDQGIDFLQRNKDKPFVLCQSYYPPHTPYNPPRAFADAYAGTEFQPAEYWGAVTAVDACVGRLLKKLEEIGQLDNTVVVFTSDHGEHFGRRPGGSNKRNAYDEAARVPLIVRYPRLFEGGRVCRELVSNVDIMPTLLELAGLKIPESLEGTSLVAPAAGKAVGWRTSVVIENKEDLPGKSKEFCNSRGVRTDRYKLILRDELSVRATDLRELYDCTADPLEKTNLYGKDHAAQIATILDELEAWARKTGDAKGLELVASCRADLGLAASNAAP